MQELIQFCNTDRQREILQAVIDDHVKEAMLKASEIPIVNPGDCDVCGEWSGRLVDGYCAPCMDKHSRAIWGKA